MMKKLNIFNRRPKNNMIPLADPIVEKTGDARMVELENSQYEMENGSDLPTIQFGSKACMIALGKWMEVLSSDAQAENYVADALDWYAPISFDDLTNVSREFAKLLIQADVSPTEKIIVDEFDKNEGLLKCYFETSKKNVDMNYTYPNQDDFSELGLKEGKNKTIYHYTPEQTEMPKKLWLASYTRENPETGVIFERDLEIPHVYYAVVTDEQYKTIIQISYSHVGEDDEVQNVDCDKLEVALMEMQMPQRIDTTFKMVQSTLLCRCEDFQHIFITEEKMEENKECWQGNKKEITNQIYVTKGKVKQFVVTKNGRTISVNLDGSWSHKRSNKIVSVDPKGNMGYTIANVSEQKRNNINPIMDYEIAEKEVNDAEEMVYALIKGD